MQLINYYETLSEIQKRKWGEKQGNVCYQEWFDTLHEEYTLEEAGAILLGLMFYDRTGGTLPLPDDIAKVIDSDRATRSLFRTYMEKTAAGSKEWINKHKLKNTDDKTEEATEELPKKDEVSKTLILTDPNGRKVYAIGRNHPTSYDEIVKSLGDNDINNVIKFIEENNQLREVEGFTGKVYGWETMKLDYLAELFWNSPQSDCSH